MKWSLVMHIAVLILRLGMNDISGWLQNVFVSSKGRVTFGYYAVSVSYFEPCTTFWACLMSWVK